jgi:ankyrin repeat protein
VLVSAASAERRASLLASRDKDGNTPLHLAATANSPSAVCELARAGAEVNTRNATASLDTPLHAALKQGAAEAVKQLLRVRGIRLDIENSNRETVLQLAGLPATNAAIRRAVLLFSKKAKDRGGRTAPLAAPNNIVDLGHGILLVDSMRPLPGELQELPAFYCVTYV